MKQITYILLPVLLALSACRQKAHDPGSHALIDTNRVSIFKWDTSLYQFPRHSRSLNLTNHDIQIIDNLLTDEADWYSKRYSKEYAKMFNNQVPADSFTIDLAKYRCQYFPYEDSLGNKLVYICCFKRPFPAWRTETYRRYNGAGFSELWVTINLSNKKVEEFSIGGNG